MKVEESQGDIVGPVLVSGDVADAIILAIKQLNRNVIVQDRGAYLRVSVPKQCTLVRGVIEEKLGRSLVFPGDLELVMLSFQGKLTVSEDKAVWKCEEGF